MKTMVAFGDIPARTAEGQAMLRNMKGTKLGKQYEKAPTQEAKAKLRVQMAQLVIDDAEEHSI